MWLKLPDEYGDDPRLVEHGAALLGADVAGQLYSARHLTDGVVSERVFTRRLLVDEDAVDLLDRLVDVGLWHRPGHGCPECPQPQAEHVVSHEYLRNNPTRAQAEDRRAKRAAAGRAGGRRSGAVRRSKAGVQARDEASASANGEHADKPRPVPSSSFFEGGRDGADRISDEAQAAASEGFAAVRHAMRSAS